MKKKKNMEMMNFGVEEAPGWNEAPASSTQNAASPNSGLSFINPDAISISISHAAFW